MCWPSMNSNLCSFSLQSKNEVERLSAVPRAIHRKNKDGDCTFYHNTLRTKTKPTGHIERYGFTAVVPILTALLLSSLNDLQFFFVFLYALFEFSCASIIGKFTSRHLFPYRGFPPHSNVHIEDFKNFLAQILIRDKIYRCKK